MTKLMGSASSLKWILPDQHNKLDSSVNSSHLTIVFSIQISHGKKNSNTLWEKNFHGFWVDRKFLRFVLLAANS